MRQMRVVNFERSSQRNRSHKKKCSALSRVVERKVGRELMVLGLASFMRTAVEV